MLVAWDQGDADRPRAVWFPTAGEIIDMHDTLIERTGGELGILHRGPIEAAIARARWGPFRHGGGLAERAALLLRGIAQDHPFVDGNKRAAFESAALFLDHNGVYIDAAPGEIPTFMVRVARSTLTVRDITRWLQDRLRRY